MYDLAVDPFGNGGSSDTGKTAERFLHPKIIQHVLDPYKTDSDEQRQQLSNLLSHFHVITRVIATDRKVACTEFHDYNIEAYLLYRNRTGENEQSKGYKI